MIQMLTMAAQALAVAASVLCNLQGAGVELLPVPSAVLQPLVRSARIAAMFTESFCAGPPSVVAEVPATPKKGPAPDAPQAATSHDDSPTESDADRVGPDTHHGRHRSSSPEVSLGGAPLIVGAGEYHPGDLVSIGGSITVLGEIEGDIVSVGGTVRVEGAVGGDVVLVGGVGTVDGTVKGQVLGVASRLAIGDHAEIRGDCVNAVGSIDRSKGARIGGQFTSIGFPNLGWFATGHGPLRFLLFLLFWVAFVGTAVRFLGVLVTSAIAPDRIEGALSRPRPSWILAFLLGLVLRVFSGLLIVVLMALCVTIPIALALWLCLRIVIWMGLASISLEFGRRIGRTVFRTELSYFASILLGFLFLAIIGFIPLFGWILTGILSTTALGLMLLTRFGGKHRVAATVPPPAG